MPLLFGWFVVLLSALTSAQQPDPNKPDGDPCCGHPDTWGEVAAGFGFAGGSIIACVAVAYLAVALGRFALEGETPSVRGRKRVAIGAFYLGIWLVIFFGFGVY